MKDFLMKLVMGVILLSLVSACSLPQRGSSLNNRDKGILIGAGVGAAIGVVTTSNAPVMAMAGGVAGGLIGHYLDRKVSQPDFLAQAGVKSYQIGEEVTVIIPADSLFIPNTPNFQPQAQTLLPLIVQLVETYPPKSVLTVTAFTDQHPSSARDGALSRTQAGRIADYLWENKVDARWITAKGGKKRVTHNESEKGRDINRRIEIDFRLFE